MPTATVEIAYLSNPREAALLGSSDFRQQAALAIRDGIERGDPAIATRKAEIAAWQQAHPGATPVPVIHPSAHPADAAERRSPIPLPAVLTALLLMGALVAVVRWRTQLVRATGLHRAVARRRRRRLRLHTLSAVSQHRWAQRSVYDDLPF
jgi:hypothetical protein